MEYDFEEIEEALDDLIISGQIFACCPNCSIYLSIKEKDSCFCLTCKSKIKLKDISYIVNKLEDN